LPGRKRPTEPASPYAAIQRFQEGGEVGFEGFDTNYTDYTDPFQDVGYDEERRQREEERNVWDENTGTWYDPIYGNTFDPNEGVWHSPDGMVYENGVWQYPAQYTGPIGPVSAGYYPQLPPAQYAEPAGPVSPYLGPTGEFREPQNLREQLDIQRQGESQYGGIPGSLLGAAGNVFQAATRGIEPLEDVRSFVGDIAEPVGRAAAFGLNPFGNLLAEQLGLPSIPDITGDVFRFGAQTAVPTTPLELALGAGFGVAGAAGGLRAGESLGRAGLRGVLEAFALDPTRPGVREAVEQALTPTVTRLAVFEDALGPVPETLAGSRGARQIENPAFARILEPDEAPVAGEQIYLHGNVNGLVGEIQPGTFVTTNVDDAWGYANLAERSIRAGLQEAPLSLSAYTGGPGTGVPRLGDLGAEAAQMRRQGLGGALTGEPGASQLRVAGGAPIDESFEEAAQRAAYVQRGIDDAAVREAQRQVREFSSDVAPANALPAQAMPEPTPLATEQEAAIRFLDEGSTTYWPELRREFTQPQWDQWNAWKGSLAGPEAAARGKDWLDLLDTVYAAPDQETRLALETVGLEKMRSEMAKSQIDNLMREAANLQPNEIVERLQTIDEQMSRLALAQAKMAENQWRLMPGGYPGRGTGTAAEAGPRWSRQAADYWMGGARQGANTPERLRAIAGGGESGVRENFITMLAEAANVPRALMAGADFSQLVTHTAPLVAAHPELLGAARRAAGVMFDQRAFSELMTEYNVGSKWAQYGLDLRLPSIAGETREGALTPSRFVAEKVPVYRETARFTTANVAGVRSQELDRFITKLEGMPKYSDAGGKLNERGLTEAKKYVRGVESITGRGNLGNAQFLDRYLSGIFFSPSYTISQVQRFGPLLNTPFTPAWNETARNLGAYVATGAGLMAAAATAGLTVDFDPGANFGKITDAAGNHINIWGGQQALARLIYQEATGKSVTEAGAVYQADRGALPLAYGVNRLSPQASILLRSVPQSVREKIGDPDLQRALWPTGRADLPGSLYNFAKNPSQATRDKALSAMGDFFTPLWVQDTVAGYRLDGLKGAALAGSLNIIGASNIPYAPSAFTQQARQYGELGRQIPFPETWAGLIQGDKWFDLSSREKEFVKESKPEIFERLQQQSVEAARGRGDPFQKALDEQTSIRQTYRPADDEIQRRLNAGEIDPYTARKALELNKDLMDKELRAVQFPESQSSRERSQIQNLISAYNGIYDRTQRPDGSVDWEGRAQLQQAMLADVAQRYGQEWAERLHWNTEQRTNANASPLQQMNEAARPLVSQYNSIPLGPEGNPNRYDARNAWLVNNALENANLFYIGRVTELKTPEAQQYLEMISPGVKPVVDFYLGFEQKGNVPRGERDAAANRYFNLPGDVDRQDWRRDHWEVDAVLWRSGYLPNVVSLEAWRLIGSPPIAQAR
jgi:hypothetical protein